MPLPPAPYRTGHGRRPAAAALPPLHRAICRLAKLGGAGLLLAVWTASSAEAADPLALSLEQLLDVSVVGASKYEQKLDQVAAAASVVTRAEIRAFGWRTLDQVLASLPGLYTTYDRQYAYLGTRGFGLPGDYNTRVLVTINGNRLNDPTYDGGQVGRFFPLDVDLIERLEYIPGPGGAVYGQNAMFGVVNIVTRSGADLGGTELALSAQQPGRQREGRASWGGRVGDGLDLVVSASAMHARGTDPAMDFGSAGVSGAASGLDGGKDREFFVHLGSRRWSLDLVDGRARKSDPTGAYLSDPLVSGQYQQEHFTVGQLNVQDRLLDGRLDVSARLFAGRHNYDSDLRYGGWYTFPVRGRWHGAELRLLWTGWRGHKLMAGIETQNNTRQDQFILDLTDPANDIRLPQSSRRTGVYLQDEWQLGSTLAATLGLRADQRDGRGVQTNPRIGLIWSPSAQTTLKGLYGRGYREANAYERNYDDGLSQVANPALRGERIDTAELVADRRVDRNLALRATLYQWTLHDLVALGTDPASGLAQYRSGPSIRARGLELSADRTWAGGARLRASASFHDVHDEQGARLLNSPRALGKLHASVPLAWADGHVGWEWLVQSGRLTRDGSSVGGHALSNLHLSTTALGSGVELALRVNNLFNKAYAYPGADNNWQNTLAADGRSVRLQLNWRR